MRSVIPLALLLALLTASCAAPEAAHPTPTPPQENPNELSVPEKSAAPEPTPTPTPDPTPTPYDYTEPVPEGEAVDDDWFADAVFIGDSRTDGLRLYSGITGASFLCYKGLTVFEVMNNKAVIQTDGGKVGVLQAMEGADYGKVYIMLGINELGWNNDQDVEDTFAQLLDKIKELEPEAQIYVQSIVPVSTEKCKQTNQAYYITNEQIAVYNEIFRRLAEEKEVYYVNVAEALVDETGELPADASSDGIHFHREGYRTWYEYLKTHTVEEETP